MESSGWRLTTRAMVVSLTKPVFTYFCVGSTQGQSEENSGIKFPGESVEPYVGSQLTIDEFDVRNKVLLIEVATPKFAFLYEDKGRIQIGDCEFCSNRRILKVVCKCKRVKYCGN